MQKRHVAVLDVGSSAITAAVGERGINKTFIIKARKEFLYDGFTGVEFLDVEGLKRAINSACAYISGSVSGADYIYVGVPSAFTRTEVKESQISFARKKRILDEDVDALFDAAFLVSSAKNTLINRSAVAYELGDGRRLANPVGECSEILKGKLSFITCSNYFTGIFRSALRAAGFKNVEFVSQSLAEAMYLLDAESRDRIAIILDVGYITTTFSLIQGDGIIFQKTFDYGGGYLTAALTGRFSVDFDEAEAIKRRINLSRISAGESEIIAVGKGNYDAESARSVIRASLDVLCEEIAECMENSGYVIPDYVPITLTGGGILYIRGAKEHVSSRLGMVVEEVSPKIPLGFKPNEASLYSLLDLTLG